MEVNYFSRKKIRGSQSYPCILLFISFCFLLSFLKREKSFPKQQILPREKFSSTLMSFPFLFATSSFPSRGRIPLRYPCDRLPNRSRDCRSLSLPASRNFYIDEFLYIRAYILQIYPRSFRARARTYDHDRRVHRVYAINANAHELC